MREKTGLGVKIFLSAGFFFAAVLLSPAAAEEPLHNVGRIDITAEREDQQVTAAPQKTTIRLDEYQSVGVPQNVGDIVKDMPIIDYRGGTQLVPDDDTLYMFEF